MTIELPDVSEFAPENYGSLSTLITELTAVPWSPLDSGQPHPELRQQIGSLSTQDIFAATGSRGSEEHALGCLSGLWLRINELDRSHTISQDMPSSTGSFWHGIMHRREGDYGNAKYWFRRVSDHEIFPALAEVAVALAEQCGVDGSFAAGSWNPDIFVDYCQRALGRKTAEEVFAIAVQQAEWQLLFDYCFGKAG